jgi:hypothetical protein
LRLTWRVMDGLDPIAPPTQPPQGQLWDVHSDPGLVLGISTLLFARGLPRGSKTHPAAFCGTAQTTGQTAKRL